MLGLVMAKKTKTISKKTGPASEQFQLRLPDGMREHLARVAARNGRSMNAEIIHALALYFETERQSAAVRAQLHANRLETGTVTIEDVDRKLAELTRKLESGELVELIKQQLK
jgi:hypothetical protein